MCFKKRGVKLNLKDEIDARIKNLENLKNEEKNILKAVEIINNAIKTLNTIFFCGNGGSASDANHLAAEFIGKFKKIRPSYPAISLCSNNSIITAVANDFSFDDVFKRQIEGLAKKNDVLVAISTSAKSKNVIKAIEQANLQGLKTILLTGKNDTSINADCIIKTPSLITAQIQEMHIVLGHIFCEIIEQSL